MEIRRRPSHRAPWLAGAAVAAAAALFPLPGLSPAPALAGSGGGATGPATTAAAPAAAGATGFAGDFTPRVKPLLAIERAAGPITIDGRLDDAGWRGAARADGFSEVEPNEKARPPVGTEVFLAYDDEKLYAAFRCEDDPAAVRATYCERDQIWSDDHVYLMIDTFGNQAWAYELSANPVGVQGDALWTAGGSEDTGFDVVYESAGRLTSTGYEVEIAVPFASLRFPSAPSQAWRVNLWRVHPRAVKAEYAWAAHSRDDPCSPCQWGTLVGLADVQPGKGLELLPAFTSRQTSARGVDGELSDGDVLGEPSLGLKYAPSSNLTAEATVNPDFSQVESDAAQIDANTTFALFYPEKRPFFQEGTDIFATPFTVVHTRSINNPDFAAKLTARPGDYGVALLSAVDAATPFTLPFEERSAFALGGRSVSNVVRVQRSLGEESRLGLLATDRRLDGGGAGSAGGVDGNLRLAQHWRLHWQALWTRTEEPDDPALTAGLEGTTFDEGRHTAAFDGETFTGRAVYGSLQRRARRWNLNLDWYERSPTFRADNGFEPQNDLREAWIVNGYKIYRERGLLRLLNLHLYLRRGWNFAGDVKSSGWQIDAAPHLRWAQMRGHVQFMRDNERYAGRQYDGTWYLHSCWDVTPHDAVSAHVGYTFGRQIARDFERLGDERSGSVSLTLRPWNRLRLETSYTHYGTEDAATGEELVSGYIARGKASLQLTPELAARLVLQYNDFAETWEADPLLTYRLSPFSIFYVGTTRDYAHLAPGEDETRSWELAERTYFLKLQYLLRP